MDTNSLISHDAYDNLGSGSPAYEEAPVSPIEETVIDQDILPHGSRLSAQPTVSSASERPPNATVIANNQSSGRRSSSLNVSHHEQEQDTSAPSNDAVARSHWNPFWLTRVPLFGFAGLFALLALALILLWYVSERSHGFALLTNNHYAWTYGPTAVLVTIVSMWRQVDFWCKSLTPWQELKKGSASPSVSILLDYISPILPTSLAAAVRFRHTYVITTIVGFLLLKLITIASTGLLVAVPTQMPARSVPLMASMTFNGSNFNNYSDSSVQSSILYETYALIAEGLPYPDGIKSDVAYQSFADHVTPNQTNAIVSAEVDAFYPFFRCEKAQVTPTVTYIDQYSENVANVSVSWPSCEGSQSKPPVTILVLKHQHQGTVPPRQLYGQAGDLPIVCSAKPETRWQLLTVADVRYNQPPIANAVLRSEQDNQTGSWEIQMMPVTGIMCSIGYSMERARVKYDHSQDPPDITVVGPLTHTNNVLQGFDLYDFAFAYTTNVDLVSTLLGNSITDALALDEPDTFFGMMSKFANKGYEAFLLNETAMIEAAIPVFNNTAIQIARYYIITNGSFPLQGQISRPEIRLHIAQLPLWLMVAGLILMLVASFTVAVTRPVDVLPCDTKSISGLALIIRRSGELQHLLQGSGRMRLSSIRAIVSPYTFRSVGFNSRHGGHFAIQPMLQDNQPVDKTKIVSQTPSKQATKWYRPLVMRRSIFVLNSAMPLSLIATLEVLQSLSDRNNGITPTLSSGNVVTIIGTRFVPALVMLFVATLYNALDFNVSLFAPFQKLKKGNATARSSIMSSLLGKTPLHALFLTLFEAHWAATFATVAALIGSVLTIVVSGLYTVESSPGARSVKIQRLDTFDPTWADSVSNDGGAAVLMSGLETLTLSYPSFTYAELALPAIQLAQSSARLVNDTKTKQSPMTVRLPALRASLNCSIATGSEYSMALETTLRDDDIGTLTINGSAPLPADCRLGGPYGNLPHVNWSSSLSLDNFSSFIGQMMDLHVGPWTGDYISYGEMNSTSQKANPPGCPSLAFTFGNFTQSGGYFVSSLTNFTTMACYQLMTEIETDVTFILPNLTITSAIPDESTIRYLQSGGDGQLAFQYRPQVHMDLELLIWNQSYGAAAAHSMSPGILEESQNSWALIDPFFSAVLSGKDTVDPAQLWGPENHDRLIEAIQGFYRRYMAQVASAKMRVAPSSSTALETYTGFWIDPDRGHLKQNNASKIALQAMLGTMFVCGVLAYWLIDTRNTLPHNPCSIAGIASLLAGSEMCGEHLAALIPDGVEWMTHKELKRHKVWDGWLFSMGWWDWKFGEESRYGIDVGVAENDGKA